MQEPALPAVSILLVDDRAENLLALEASLESLGQRLVRAASGSDALRAVLDEDFAVILMDIRMPDLDGFETMALLKQRERSRDTPIIFLSAYSEQHHILRSYASGAVDYLPKPIDPDALRSKVSVFVTLRQNQLALRAAHAELETRVQARTAELAAANARLVAEVRERETIEQRLFDQANHDGLTRLANRALLMEHLNRAVSRTRRWAKPSFAVLMLDLDRFKLVNDSLGHQVGDQLLRDFAARIERCVREIDTPARVGGDEFAILLDGIDELRDATRTAERIEEAVAKPFVIEGKEIFATTSIGIAMMDDRYKRGEELLRDADVALYRAKEAGRARHQVFDRDLHTAVMAELRLEADLARAADADEFVLHYQPIVATTDARLVGFEALIRWNHPDRGLVGPEEFIALAEASGKIRTLGRWVLDEACRQLAAWNAYDPRLTMSVNLSPHQFGLPELPDDIEQIVRETRVDPTNLALEITESAIMPRVPFAGQTLARLRDLGASISLDDFGIGYSCLSYLHELPVTTLKIDRSFIARIGQPGERPEIVGAIVSLAHTLGIAVTAEGVETAPQLARVRELGCEYAQGFYFARPLEAAAAETFLRGGHRIDAGVG